jgi:hypothetical protein
MAKTKQGNKESTPIILPVIKIVTPEDKDDGALVVKQLRDFENRLLLERLDMVEKSIGLLIRNHALFYKYQRETQGTLKEIKQVMASFTMTLEELLSYGPGVLSPDEEEPEPEKPKGLPSPSTTTTIYMAIPKPEKDKKKWN